jgi:hypothetical protein
MGMDGTDDNKGEYIQKILEWAMYGRVKEQLDEMMEGFFELVPRFLLGIFSIQEIESLLYVTCLSLSLSLSLLSSFSFLQHGWEDVILTYPSIPHITQLMFEKVRN